MLVDDFQSTGFKVSEFQGFNVSVKNTVRDFQIPLVQDECQKEVARQRASDIFETLQP
jgi:hypothetical protein